MISACEGVVAVDDTPRAVEGLAVFAAETGAPTVVDNRWGEAARGPELVGEVERIRPRTRGPAVNVNDQRWELACGCGVFRVQGWIEKAVGCYAALGRKFDRLRHRDIGWIDQPVGGTAQHRHPPGLEVDGDAGHGLGRRRRDPNRQPG